MQMIKLTHIVIPFRKIACCGKTKEIIKADNEGIAAFTDDATCEKCRVSRIQEIDKGKY